MENREKRIIVLNSGGFDSTVLIHTVAKDNPSAEITSLFFDYNQNSLQWERACAYNHCVTLGLKWKEIKLPDFNWVDRDRLESSFLEYRNLIFLSYAMSYAKSIKAEEVYVAFIDMGGNKYCYHDSSPKFYRNIRRLAKPLKIKAPFLDKKMSKFDVVDSILKKNLIIPKDSFHSCDYSDSEGNPCGKCLDCEAINLIYLLNPLSFQ